MDWAKHKAQWPNAAQSTFIRSKPHQWHVQRMGTGPVLLLLHGAGGATHSWRDVLPLLAESYDVIAPDLPGHGMTKLGALQRSSLDLMAEDLAQLLETLEARPVAIVGHSAGAAVALRLCEILPEPPRALVGVNAALEGFRGVAGWLFPVMAKVLALNPFTAGMAARMNKNPASAARLINSTGSHLSPEGQEMYRRVISEKSHVDGALRMMAQWSLDGLRARMGAIAVPVLLLTGDRDATVPPRASIEAAGMLGQGAQESLGRYGHLVHEEAPELVVERIEAFLAEHL